MNIPKFKKPAAAQPLVPIVNRFSIPAYRRLRGKRYNAKGELIGTSGPIKRADPIESAFVKRSQAHAAKLPRPVDNDGFDIAKFRPLSTRVLLKRPPQITHVNGMALPDNQWRSEQWFYVVAVGDRVTACAPGDRVIFGKNHRPKSIRLGKPFHLARESGIVAIIDGDPISLAEIVR